MSDRACFWMWFCISMASTSYAFFDGHNVDLFTAAAVIIRALGKEAA